MTIHPIDAWRGGAYVGEQCDLCANHLADVVIEEAYSATWGASSMPLCFDCVDDNGYGTESHEAQS